MSDGHDVHHLSVRGTGVRILRQGSGEPLVFLHGAGDRGEWLPVLAGLAADWAVFRPDHPGFNQSDDDERIDSVHDLAFFYLDLLDALELPRVTLVGASLGGWLAAEIAVLDPDRVTALVLIDAAGLRVAGAPATDVFTLNPVQLAELLFHDQALRSAAIERAAVLDQSPEELRNYLRNRIATSHLAWNPYFHDPKLAERLHRVTAPTVVIWGSEDRLLPVAHAQRWQELIEDARIELIADAGHLPHIEQPERVVEIVRSVRREELLA
jgi:pimeloyl-ACP methyl ester carboxylesterase